MVMNQPEQVKGLTVDGGPRMPSAVRCFTETSREMAT